MPFTLKGNTIYFKHCLLYTYCKNTYAKGRALVIMCRVVPQTKRENWTANDSYFFSLSYQAIEQFVSEYSNIGFVHNTMCSHQYNFGQTHDTATSIFLNYNYDPLTNSPGCPLTWGLQTHISRCLIFLSLSCLYSFLVLQFLARHVERFYTNPYWFCPFKYKSRKFLRLDWMYGLYMNVVVQ